MRDFFFSPTSLAVSSFFPFFSSFSLSLFLSFSFSPFLQRVDAEPGLEELDVELFFFFFFFFFFLFFFWTGTFFEVSKRGEKKRAETEKKIERERETFFFPLLLLFLLTKCSHSFACASPERRILVTKMRILSARPSS